MAAIVPVSEGKVLGRPFLLRSVTAQASTGQTDWVWVPAGARFVEVFVNLTAVNGTTPICLPSLATTDCITLNDSKTVVVGTATTTGMTGAAMTRIVCGPGVTGIADAVAVGTGGGVDVKLNTMLPRLLGVVITNDRTTGDETYTYTVSVNFRP